MTKWASAFVERELVNYRRRGGGSGAAGVTVRAASEEPGCLSATVPSTHHKQPTDNVKPSYPGSGPSAGRSVATPPSRNHKRRATLSLFTFHPRGLSVNSIFPPGYLLPAAHGRPTNTNADISSAAAFYLINLPFENFLEESDKMQRFFFSLWEELVTTSECSSVAAFKHSRSGFPAPADGQCSRI